MLIDWFTVAAQALNFTVLVWLMKRFLYQPVLDAIDQREQRIASELAEADEKLAEAASKSAEFQRRSQDFDQQRAGLLTQAAADAETERKRLLDAGRVAADNLIAQQQRALADAQRSLQQMLAARVQQQVFAIARRTLKDLASIDLEARACTVFNQRLRALSGPAKADLAQALSASDGSPVVRSAFELPAMQREAIQGAINQTFAVTPALRFETAPDLVGGIELSVSGRRLAWTITDYLDAMEQGVSALLKAPTGASDPGTSPALTATLAQQPS